MRRALSAEGFPLICPGKIGTRKWAYTSNDTAHVSKDTGLQPAVGLGGTWSHHRSLVHKTQSFTIPATFAVMSHSNCFPVVWSTSLHVYHFGDFNISLHKNLSIQPYRPHSCQMVLVCVFFSWYGTNWGNRGKDVGILYKCQNPSYVHYISTLFACP